MAKAEWGTKRTCPKCGERFYDLQKPFPLECVACGATFEPEVVLKSKQSLPEEQVKKPPKPKVVKAEEDTDEVENFEDIEIEDDDSADIIEDDDLDDDEDVPVKRKSRSSDEDSI